MACLALAAGHNPQYIRVSTYFIGRTPRLFYCCWCMAINDESAMRRPLVYLYLRITYAFFIFCFVFLRGHRIQDEEHCGLYIISYKLYIWIVRSENTDSRMKTEDPTQMSMSCAFICMHVVHSWILTTSSRLTFLTTKRLRGWAMGMGIPWLCWARGCRIISLYIYKRPQFSISSFFQGTHPQNRHGRHVEGCVGKEDRNFQFLGQSSRPWWNYGEIVK